MKKIFLFVFVLITFKLFSFEPHFMNDPAISPDGKTVCFVYLGDLWTVPFTGGEAKKLTSSEGSDFNPIYSPNGKDIAFNSNRDGWNCIYLIPAEGGIAKSVSEETFDLLDWFPNGSQLLVQSYEPGFGKIFMKISLDGKIDELTRFGGEFAAVSPDGEKIVFSRYGYAYRPAYKGSFNGELWEYNIASDKFSKLTNTEYSERYPVYSSVGNKIYFGASDGKLFQLFVAENYDFKDRKKLSDFSEWNARDLSIAKQNDNLVFEKFDEIWKYDAGNNKVSKLQISINQDIDKELEQKEDFRNKFDNFAVSPNGKLVVFSYKFDLFAVPEKGGEVKRITFDKKGISDIEIMDDNETIFFTKMEDGNPQLFKVNIKNITDIQKIKWSENKYIDWLEKSQNRLLIHFSNDEEYYQLAIADSSGKHIHTLINDKLVLSGSPLSEDENHLIFQEVIPPLWKNDLYIYDLKEKKQHRIYSFDGNLSNLKWGKNNKFAFFSQNGNIRKIDLQAKNDFYTEKDYWKDILSPSVSKQKDKKKNKEKSKQTKKDKKLPKIDYDGIELRTSTLVSKPGWNNVSYIINDSTFYYLNHFNDNYTLRKINFYNDEDEKIYKFNNEPINLIYNEGNKCFYFVTDDNLKKLNPKSKKVENIKNKFKYEYNRLELNAEIFRQVWTEFGHGFYDPKMHETNWNKEYKTFSKYLQYAYTPEILEWIVDELIGRVNASHTGFYPRNDAHRKFYQQAFGGFTLDWKNYPKEGIRIKKIYRKSKLNKPFHISEGDILLSVDGEKVGKGLPFVPQFMDKVGDKIKLEIMSGDSLKTVMIKGLSWGKDYSMFYDDWVAERSEKVKKWSHGKIGYLHIRGMDNPSYDKFYQDLFTKNYDKKALIIDVRNNGGGYTHDIILEVLTKRAYAFSTNRYFHAKKYKTPSSAWQKPLAVLINENSFSDAEIFPAIFQELKLGKVIGVPTSGSVIGTGHRQFMDGSSMRMPGNGWFLLDGKNMEGNGVQPDILVQPTPKQIESDDDIQLKKAVEEMMREIGD